MLFEMRTEVPAVSAEWIPARDAFLAGQSREAWELAVGRRGAGPLEAPSDAILNMEIARACGAVRKYLALSRFAVREFPRDPFVQLYHARVLLTRNRHLAGIYYLRELENTLGVTHRTYWGTELACLYSEAGFEASGRALIEQLEGAPGMDSAFALYTLASANESVQAWDAAIDCAERSVEAAPNWTRARANLVNCLLARGRIEAAEAVLVEGEQRGHEDAHLEAASAVFALSMGRFDDALVRLTTLLERWPQADFAQWTKRTLCILLVEMGDAPAARALADGDEEKLSLPEIPEASRGAHALLPIPLVSQNKNQCVPTAVAMAAWPQGRKLEIERLFREMEGRNGTALWRMRRWTEENGFRLIPIRLEKAAIVEMLEHGVPLVGSLEGAFNSHVDTVCGYHDELDVLYVRDPGHWMLAAWPTETALARYAMHGGVMAIVDAGRADVIAAAERWESAECGALLDLSESVAEGNLAAAEAAYAKIPEDSDALFMREMHGHQVTVAPKAFHERMEAIARNAEAPAVARFRALMALGTDSIEPLINELLAEEGDKTFGPGVHRYLRLRQAMGDGAWQEALALIDAAQLTGGGISAFWEMRSDVLSELGDQEGCRTALARAIELDPLRMSLREKKLHREQSTLSHTEYLEEFERLLANDPDDKRLLFGRASTLEDGPDGLAFEEAARETIRWFPREPEAYWRLYSWYELQRRQDLADALMEEAHRLLPEDIGRADDDTTVEKTQDGEEATDSEEKPEAKEAELPEEKDALLDLLRSDHPMRAAAMERLLALNAEGHLSWYQRARLVGWRLVSPDLAEGGTIDAASLLVDAVPGPAQWFARAVCEPFVAVMPSVEIARAVNEWFDRVVGDVRQFPLLWFERVLLLEYMKEKEAALAELEALLERYPATSSALYRMGMVKHGQSDLAGAQSHFERALAVNPGLVGAMEMLRQVHRDLGRADAALECTRMLRKKMPYSVAYLRDEGFAVATLAGLEAAEATIDAAREQFPAARLEALRAHLRMQEGQLDGAEEALAAIGIDEHAMDDELYDDYLQVDLGIAWERSDSARVLDVCRRGLERWPGSTRLVEIQADILAESDAEASRVLLREQMLDGGATMAMAWRYAQLDGAVPEITSRELVQSAERERRVGLAELFAEAMTHPPLGAARSAYLEWAVGEFPESDYLTSQLANHLDLMRESQRAAELAERLYKRHPNEPEYAHLLGQCLLRVDVERAKTYLEEASQRNRSADVLFDLARCHHRMRDTEKSNQLYWEVLEQNPFSVSAVTNLYLNGDSKERLWPYAAQAVQQNVGAEFEYFLVVAVRLAVDNKSQLPLAWYPLAVSRWSEMSALPGLLDERKRLKRALLAWGWSRPADTEGQTGAPQGWLATFPAVFVWPGVSWVPRAEDEMV